MTVKVLISGAAGNIGYAIAPMICNGEVFGETTKLDVVIFDIPPCEQKLVGLQMEIEDGAYPLVHSVIIATDPVVAFKGVQYAFLIGGMPRGPGMERKDLIAKNTNIFSATGKAIEASADKNIKILVVANPANTNCWTLMQHCPSIPKKNFSAMTRLDFNRERSMISKMVSEKLAKPVYPTDIHNCIIWGNHSSTQYPDVSFATYEGKHVLEIIPDKKAYLQGDFIKTVQQRGKAVIDARGLSSALSAAKAACDHMRTWVHGTPKGEYVSMAVHSLGNKYGINEDLIYSFPVTCEKGDWHFVEKLAVSDFSKKLLTATQDELESEKVDAKAVSK